MRTCEIGEWCLVLQFVASWHGKLVTVKRAIGGIQWEQCCQCQSQPSSLRSVCTLAKHAPEKTAELSSQVWQLLPIIPAAGRLGQEACQDFGASLDSTLRPCLDPHLQRKVMVWLHFQQFPSSLHTLHADRRWGRVGNLRICEWDFITDLTIYEIILLYPDRP